MSAPLSDTWAVEAEARRAQQAYAGRLIAAAVRRLLAAPAALVRAAAKAHARNRAFDTLMTYDDRLLADIGLSRGHVMADLVAAEAGLGRRAAQPVAPTPVAETPAPRVPTATVPANEDRIRRVA